MKSKLFILPCIIVNLALLMKQAEAFITLESPVLTTTTEEGLKDTSESDLWSNVTLPGPMIEAGPPKINCQFLCSKMTYKQVLLISKLQEVFHGYVYLAVGLTATVANSLNLCILFKQKQALSPFTYMTAIAACDLVSGVCLMYLAISWNGKIGRLSHVVRLLSYHGGLLVFALNETCATAAGLLAMALGIDRLIAVRYPLKRKTMCRVKMARITSILIIALGIFINLLTVFRLKMIWIKASFGKDYPTLSYTSFGKLPETNNAARTLALIFRFLVPFSTMILTSSLTLHALLQSYRFRKSAAAAAANTKKTEEMSALSLQCVAITIGVTLAFFITQAPRSAYYVDSMLFGNQHRGYFAYEVFIYVNEVLAWCNTNVNFFIYAALSKGFRKDVSTMCACFRSKKAGQSGNDQNSSMQSRSSVSAQTTNTKI